MSNTVISLVGEVVLAIVILTLIAIITWLFFRRSLSYVMSVRVQLYPLTKRPLSKSGHP